MTNLELYFFLFYLFILHPMNFDIKYELKYIILIALYLSPTYSKSHPNFKYALDLIIDEIFYVLESGVSSRNLRSSINF